jgi:predicted nucleic acid-binding protein
MTLVIDASALVFATTGETPSAKGALERLRSDVCHAPHLIDAEFGSALRRKAARREVSAVMAEDLLDTAPELVDFRHEHHGLVGLAAWALRDRLTFYDALYVVIAATFEVPLLTVDRRLARTPGLPCQVEMPAA